MKQNFLGAIALSIFLSLCFVANAYGETKRASVLIIGSGPAAMGAAMYAAGARLPDYPVIVMSGEELGGQITQAHDVFNWPSVIQDSGAAIMDRFITQVKNHGAQIVNESVVSVDFSTQPFKKVYTNEGTLWEAQAVIIATGSSPRKLGIPGEQEYWGRGVATCVLCEAELFQDLDVAIVGGGDSAMDKALHMARYAKHVTLFVRKKVRAKPMMIERVHELRDKITVIQNKEVVEVFGDGQKVTGLRVKDGLTDTVEEIPMDGLFLSIGSAPNSGLFRDYLVLLPSGHIMTTPGTTATSVSGVFAAGIVADARYNQGFIEAGFGGQAGIDAVKYIRYEMIRTGLNA